MIVNELDVEMMRQSGFGRSNKKVIGGPPYIPYEALKSQNAPDQPPREAKGRAVITGFDLSGAGIVVAFFFSFFFLSFVFSCRLEFLV